MEGRRTDSSALVRAGFALLALLAYPQIASGASPSPSAEPEGGDPGPPGIVAWLDRPIPADAAAGASLPVGVLLWDETGHSIPDMGGTIQVRVHATDPSVEPATVSGRSDWPGHFTATIVIPKGGVGSIDFFSPSTVCENDVCRPDEFLFPIAGAGLPPEAPITGLAEARILLPSDPLVADRAADISVRLEPRSDWDPDALVLPSSLVIRARQARGSNLTTATLSLTDPGDRVYEGSLTLPAAGDLVLEAATDVEGGDATRFPTSMTRITVEAADTAEAADPGPARDADDSLPLWFVVGMAVVALAGAGVLAVGFVQGGR
jgi:hypothetical protein